MDYQQPPQGYQQPPQGYNPGPYQQPPQGGKGMGIAALVLGCLAIILAWWPFIAIIGVICGAVALVLAVMARKKDPNDGIALGGLIVGIIGLALSFIFGLVICTICPMCSMCGAAGQIGQLASLF